MWNGCLNSKQNIHDKELVYMHIIVTICIFFLLEFKFCKFVGSLFSNFFVLEFFYVCRNMQISMWKYRSYFWGVRINNITVNAYFSWAICSTPCWLPHLLLTLSVHSLHPFHTGTFNHIHPQIVTSFNTNEGTSKSS